MSETDNKRLEERIAHLELDVKYEREWNLIPEELKPTSKSRWDQIRDEAKTQESRRLGIPNR